MPTARHPRLVLAALAGCTQSPAVRFETEPLPADHPLWKAPHFLMTPHVAAAGPYLDERRLDLLIENCRRLAQGEELINIVDKTNWF